MTKYNEIAQTLKDGIVAGKYEVGSVLPTEFELCAIFQASRQTIRSAIGELARQGLVSRTKKLGTRVESRLVQNTYLHRLNSLNDLVQFSNENKKEIQSIDLMVVDRELAAQFGMQPGLRVLKVSTMRFASVGEKLPIGWTDIYVVSPDLDYGKLQASIQARPDILVSTILEEEFNVSVKTIHQEIDSILVPGNLVDVLHTSSPAPALKVTRRYVDMSNEVVQISVTVHPSGRFLLLLDATREM